MRWWLVLAGFIFFGCSKPIKQPIKFQVNIDSLLRFHKNQLSDRKAALNKLSNVNGKQSSVEIPAKEVNWDIEFESFRALDIINKPINSNAYVSEVKNDDKSNLIIKCWTTQRALPLQQLKVYYLGDFKQIKRLEARIIQHNFIYNSTKELVLNFSVLGATPTAEDYKIAGHQKFFWEEPRDFSLIGNIHLK